MARYVMESRACGASSATPFLRRGMKRGKVSPLLLLVVAAAGVLVAGVFLRCRPAGCGTSDCAPIPPSTDAVAAAPNSPAAPAPSPAVKAAPSSPAAVSAVSTSAIAAVAATQASAAEQRMAELAMAMNESYRKLGELRRAVQDSPEVRQLQAAGEEARRELEAATQSDPAIKALTDRRKALLDEMTALQSKQSELARTARAEATNTAVRTEGQAVLAKIRETSAELGTLTRTLEKAKKDYAAGNPAVAELAARVADTREQIRKAINGNPEILALDQQIQAMAAESRQVGQRQQLRSTPVPEARPE